MNSERPMTASSDLHSHQLRRSADSVDGQLYELLTVEDVAALLRVSKS